MRGLAARDRAVDRGVSVDGLGASALAVRLSARGTLPPTAALLETSDGAAWALHALPLRCLVTPFPAAPEIGLRLDYCFDAAGDRERFALLLAAEGDWLLSTASVAAGMQLAVQGALQMGTLELPPCTSDEEWHAFRAGLNELVYTRFGLVVEDCVPVDLHPASDFALQLGAATAVPFAAAAPTATSGPAAVPAPSADAVRAAAAAPAAAGVHAAEAAPAVSVDLGRAAPPLPAAGPAAVAASDAAGPWLAWVRAEDMPVHGWRAAATAAAAGKPAALDAAALRRLFLELPALAAALRALPAVEGDGSFAPLQGILRRLALAALSANTMPSLAHAAPGQRLARHAQQLRAAHALSAQAALDDAWALLASMRNGLDTTRLDEADRVLSNLEYSLAQRRAIQP